MLDFLIQKWLYAYYQIGFRYMLMASFAFFTCYFVFYKPMMRRKIQPKLPHLSDYARDILNSIVSIGIFAAISVWTLFIIKPYTNLYDDFNAYSKAYYAFTFVWMFFLHDAYFYWSHRLMHHPKLFRWVHLTHHKSNNPSPWTAYAFHPLEAVVEAAIVPIFAFTIPIHRSAIIFYMVFQIAYNVYGHLGYEIFPKNFHKHWFGQWLNTSVAHNMHHKYSVKNYGLWTVIWDRLFNTLDVRYDETYERVTEGTATVVENSAPLQNRA